MEPQLLQYVESLFPDLSEKEKQLLPSFTEAEQEHLYATAYELYRNGKYERAKQVFYLLTLLNGVNRKFWMGLGASQQMLKDYRAALGSYSIAAAQNPEDPAVHEYAAECFFALNDLPLAIKTLGSARLVAGKNGDRSLVERLEMMQKAWKAL